MRVFWWIGYLIPPAVVFAAVFAVHYGIKRDRRKSAIFALGIAGIVLLFSILGGFMR
jgi:hypothetical protein